MDLSSFGESLLSFDVIAGLSSCTFSSSVLGSVLSLTTTSSVLGLVLSETAAAPSSSLNVIAGFPF
jgi:hypothetical protein